MAAIAPVAYLGVLLARMTDIYPRSWLDGGGQGHGRAFTASPPPPAGQPSGVIAPSVGTPTTSALSTAAHPGASIQPGPATTTAAVVGAMLLVLGTGVLAGGAALGIGYLAVLDGPYVTSPAWDVSAPGYAVQVGELSVRAPDPGLDLMKGLLGEVRVRAEATGGEDVFLGVARADDAALYLSGVRHTFIGADDAAHERPGGPPSTSPQDAGIWVAHASGTGRQSVTVEVQDGDWVAVIMPVDASEGLQAEIDVGASVPWLGVAAVLTVLAALVLLAAGAALVHRGAGSSVPEGTAGH